MPGSTSKKVLVLRFDREPLPGYVTPPASFLDSGIELLTAGGNLILIPYQEVKAVCFVRTWDEPHGLAGKRTFASRPKSEGLWVRFAFRDADSLEGLMANRLAEIDGRGLWASPPDATGNTQRIFVPRGALIECAVLGVVGGQNRGRKSAPSENQMKMFD
ncbi:MAG: hypothetical protein SFV18_11710 [Bryobacteraceae bacterium]|nr:hypothetical protein [Bryobacteraceae bacterium]